MPTEFKYKSSSAGSWTTVPDYAIHGTRMGTFDIKRPKPAARDGRFRPCAAIGKPVISMDSATMTAYGMNFWQAFFPAASSLDVEFWLTARDPYTNNWHYFTGWFLRPVYEAVKVGSGSANTMYENSHFEMINIEEVAGP